MKYQVTFLESARQDNKSIKKYLSRFYPGTPKRFSAKLKSYTANLMDMPYMFPVYEENRRYRKMVVANYLVFYTVDDTQHLVQIHRIIPGTWDISQHLV
jgi:plasmid stabilization system protein ParE